jgi:hypothetical protein
MLKIVKSNGSKKYEGNVVVTDAMAAAVDQTFKSKFDAFCYGIENNWSKKSIMKYCLDTENNQYFHNYYTKYQAAQK